MVIILGSKNPSKERALRLALEELKIDDIQIISFDAKSRVSSKPIGFEIIRGAENRNMDCKKYALEQQLNYDYICSIEGGYSLDENGLPFIVTYAVAEDRNGRKSTGKSLGLRLTRSMYEYLREGNSLNALIEEMNDIINNKQNEGITGYLSNGILKRDKVDVEAVLTAFIPLIFHEKREELNQAIILKLERRK